MAQAHAMAGDEYCDLRKCFSLAEVVVELPGQDSELYVCTQHWGVLVGAVISRRLAAHTVVPVGSDAQQAEIRIPESP